MGTSSCPPPRRPPPFPFRQLQQERQPFLRATQLTPVANCCNLPVRLDPRFRQSANGTSRKYAGGSHCCRSSTIRRAIRWRECAVLLSASPGAVAQAAGVTDQNAARQQSFSGCRLPPESPVGSVSAGGQTVNFSALAASNSLQNFPAFTESGQQTPSATAFAALLRYYQNAGTLSAPNGLATTDALTQYLTSSNGFVLSATGKFRRESLGGRAICRSRRGRRSCDTRSHSGSAE